MPDPSRVSVIRVTGTWWRIARPAADPLELTPEPADGRWQRGRVIRATYLADSEPTAWAEWYRHSAELAVPPQARLPRDVWRFGVDVADIADLTDPNALESLGIAALSPTRRQWPATQRIGESLWRSGRRGLLAPSAAHSGGRVLAIFRPDRRRPAGLRAVRPPRHYVELPPLPTGMRT